MTNSTRAWKKCGTMESEKERSWEGKARERCVCWLLSISLRNSAEEFQVILIHYKNTGKTPTCFPIPQAPYFGAQYYYVSKNHIPAKLCFTVSEISVQFYIFFFSSSKKPVLSEIDWSVGLEGNYKVLKVPSSTAHISKDSSYPFT